MMRRSTDRAEADATRTGGAGEDRPVPHGAPAIPDRLGVLLMAYGTPDGLDGLESYYAHIRRGRAPSPELVEALRRRYEAIGGRSPLVDIVRSQAAALAAELGRRGAREPVVEIGMKHSAPLIEEAVGRLARAGVSRAVGIVMAPHYSAASVGEYMRRALVASRESGGPEFEFVRSWRTSPGLIRFLTDSVRAEMERIREGARLRVIFTAHSLPSRVLETGDPYEDEVKATATAVAGAAGLADWGVAWQSGGRTPEPWLAPDLSEALRAAASDGVQAVVVCPAGFVADHLEILYDIDIAARRLAGELGLRLLRTPSPNADPRLVRALADEVATAAARTARARKGGARA